MPALETPLRKTLEKRIVEARDVAEDAARAALETLLLSSAQKLDHLSDAEKKLRRSLQAKERQLGSREALIRECAYETWHTMLFARFLEAAGLLMHPDHGVSVSMEDCTELAVEEGDLDGYATAARYAAHMLPGIFRPHDPLLQVRFAPEYRQWLEALLDGIPRPAFTADDGLGWVYQFWQTARKQQVNASGRKIAGADISAVTQLFTEHYMVQFMLHNTVGAWWTARHPDVPLPTELSYLRLNDDGTPAAGSFPGWPATVKELRLLDPCCGSGHFLVAAFALLRRLRMLEEGLSEADAAEAVLRDNLHGLELDPRCTQLAAFNLTLEAWKAGGYRPIPTPQVACSGLSIGASVEDWLAFASSNNTRNVFRVLHDEFKNAPDLGSLINPREGIRQRLGIFGDEALEGLPELIATLLESEHVSDPAAAIYGENVQGVAHAARLLGNSYDLIITNVPFLGRGNQNTIIAENIERRFSAGKADLAYAFIIRLGDMLKSGGSISVVSPQGWMSSTRQTEFRKQVLKNKIRITLVVRLGDEAFEYPVGTQVSISFFENTEKPSDHIILIDASEKGDKSDHLIRKNMFYKKIIDIEKNTMILDFREEVGEKRLRDYVSILRGLSTGETQRFERYFWEIKSFDDSWQFFHETSNTGDSFSGRSSTIFWENESGVSS